MFVLMDSTVLLEFAILALDMEIVLNVILEDAQLAILDW